nr:MAG: hypothetical protein [Bacteriophage sp.]
MELAFLFFYKIEIKMATIAKGSITLVNVNDAYSVLFTPDSCAIKADFDGTNPDLTNAYTDITVVRGEERHTFKLTLASFSNTAITYQQIAIDAYTKRIRLTSIPSDVLSGALTFTITTDDEFVADVTFTYSVIRETSMLDWILDWENNKTVIGDSYLISPKIFVGKKVENAEGLKTLTGVYIGPDDTNTAGIYGYKEGKDVFHINAKGAMLGGWNVLSDCITTSNKNGTISLGADGNLFYRTNKNELVWSLFQDGSATFAKGNVMLNSDGSAVFTGSIKASSGNVGGWTIDENVLYNTNIALNSAKHIIGVGGSNTFNVNNIKGSIQQHGGVYMFYDNANSYGLQGYLPSKNVDDNLYMIQSCFSLGSINQIASWNFDADSLYMGAKVNMQKKYTASSGDITIGSQGMRGNSWYIDTDGSVSFLKGEVQFAESSGSMVGWNLNAKRLSNPNVAIVSDTANAGIFMSVADGTDFNNFASSSLTDYIDAHGGIYMKIKTDGVSFAAYDKDGYRIFKLRSNGVSSIASWNIENDALFVGSKKVDAGSFTDAAGSMTFSSTGIRGNKWRLEADGSGSLAGDMISWNASGKVDFKAKVSADNITAGTISACTIQSSTDNPTWKLNPDGSGYLANRNISWKTDGSLTMSGEITASSGKIGDFSINSDGLYYGNISKWTSTEKTNMSQIGPNFVRMEQQVGYFSAGDIAYQKIGLGAGSDPTQDYKSGKYCGSALYIYRKMNSISDMYFPVAQIISDNVANRNIGLRVVGGLQVHGGIIESGYVMEYTKSGDATVLDVSFGTTFLLFNRASESHDFFFPKLSQIREQLGISDKTKSFCVPVRVICGSGSSDCCISAASAASNSPGKEEGGSIVDNNGNWDYKNNKHYGANRMALCAGDSWSFALIYTPSTGYYIQILNTQN